MLYIFLVVLIVEILILALLVYGFKKGSEDSKLPCRHVIDTVIGKLANDEDFKHIIIYRNGKTKVSWVPDAYRWFDDVGQFCEWWHSIKGLEER